MLLTGVLLLAAVGLVVAALSTGHTALAWGSVALSAAVAVMIVVRWRRRWNAPEAEPVELLDEEPVEAASGGQPVDPESDAVPGEPSPQPGTVTTAEHAVPVAAALSSAAAAGADHVAEDAELADAEAAEPGEEDTDAADLLVVYELTDEVLVVDGHPRYHLTRCPRPDRARAERLSVREARELGFTPCDRCRPDKALARRHRAASATADGSWSPGRPGVRHRFGRHLRRLAAAVLRKPGGGAGYPGRTGSDPAITGEPPEERGSVVPSVEPGGCGPSQPR